MRAYLAVALLVGGCAAAQPTRWEKPGATQEALCEIVSSAFNKLHWTERATTTRHCLPHAWERGDIKKTLTVIY